jgi:hypothetical protein
VSNDLNIPQSSSIEDDPAIDGEIRFLAERLLDDGGDPGEVVGVDQSLNLLTRWKTLLRIHAVDSKGFLRPVHRIQRAIVDRPAACVGQPLRLRQIRFASA